MLCVRTKAYIYIYMYPLCFIFGFIWGGDLGDCQHEVYPGWPKGVVYTSQLLKVARVPSEANDCVGSTRGDCANAAMYNQTLTFREHSLPYCGWTKSYATLKPWKVFWSLAFAGESSFQGFLRWCRISSIHSTSCSACKFAGRRTCQLYFAACLRKSRRRQQNYTCHAE